MSNNKVIPIDKSFGRRLGISGNDLLNPVQSMNLVHAYNQHDRLASKLYKTITNPFYEREVTIKLGDKLDLSIKFITYLIPIIILFLYIFSYINGYKSFIDKNNNQNMYLFYTNIGVFVLSILKALLSIWQSHTRTAVSFIPS